MPISAERMKFYPGGLFGTPAIDVVSASVAKRMKLSIVTATATAGRVQAAHAWLRAAERKMKQLEATYA